MKPDSPDASAVLVIVRGDDCVSDMRHNDGLGNKKEEAGAPSCSNPKALLRHASSYIRCHDLDIPKELHQGGPDVISSTLHDSMQCYAGRRAPDEIATASMFFVDQNLKLTFDKLVQLGFSEVTDESGRFEPGRETANILQKREKYPSLRPQLHPDWPIRPWHAASLSNLQEILIWNGLVNNNKGFGHDWPIVKARGIILASPRTVANFLWDSSNVHKYNAMSVGRHDGTVFQEGIDTRAEDSPYGFEGCAKILKSHNKLSMVPRIIEIVSILHARPLNPPLAAPGTYIIVNRSIWESNTEAETNENLVHGNTTVAYNPSSKLIRSEMLLGAQLLRPLNGGNACEITTMTHALVPGMKNKMMAKTAANVSAAKILRDIQAAIKK